MKRLAWLLLAWLLLSGCASAPDSSPDYYATQISGEAAAYAAGQAQRATQQAERRIEAQATQQARQELDQAAAQGTALAAEAQATQAAWNYQATATEYAAAVQATQSAAALAAAQATQSWLAQATPYAATQAAVVRQVEIDAARAAWQRDVGVPAQALLPTLFWTALIAAVVVLMVVALIGLWRILPALELRLRSHSTPDGRVILVLDPQKMINVLDPSRMFAPGMQSGPQGLRQSGAADMQAQAATTARAQHVEGLRALPRWMAEQYAGQAGAAPMLPAQIEVVDAAGEPGHWVDEVETKMLEG